MVAAAVVVGATSVASGVMQKKAAGKAADAQTRAADQSLDVQERLAARQEQLLQDAQRESLVDVQNAQSRIDPTFTEAIGKSDLGYSRLRQGLLDTGTATEDLYNRTYSPIVDPGLRAYSQVQDLLGVSGDSAAQQRAMQLLEQTPGYQFQKQQGIKTITQQQAAKGVGGGTRLKAIGEFVNNLANQNFNQRIQQLGRVADVGISNLGNRMMGADKNIQMQLAERQAYQDQQSAKGKLLLEKLNQLNQMDLNKSNVRFKGAGSTADVLSNQAVNTSNILQNRGAAIAESKLAQGKAMADAISGVGGATYGYLTR